MRSQWEFKLAARGCHFERAHTYIVSSGESIELEGAQLDSLECKMKVLPLDHETPDSVDQYVKLVFELPVAPEKCEEFAHYLASVAAERLAFHARADLRVIGGLVSYKRIPETPAEEAEVGDRPYGMTLRLVEVVGTPSFENLGGKLESAVAIHPGLLAQFNETARDPSPIRKFLGFFRIVESFVHSGPVKGSLKKALKTNEKLLHRFLALKPNQSFDDFVDAIVDARHECAHLKLDKGFGYVPADPRIEKALMPHLALLEELAYACVAGA
jgi:hypothetical protein